MGSAGFLLADQVYRIKEVDIISKCSYSFSTQTVIT